MKKKGFTLIEVVVSMAIISILFGATLSLSKMSSNISNDIKFENSLYEIENLLSYAKAYCKKNNMAGEIQIDSSRNQIIFFENSSHVIKRLILPEEAKLTYNKECLDISSRGHIKRGLTILVQDKWSKTHNITIRVGIDLIDIKDNDDFLIEYNVYKKILLETENY
ncbi:type II secretion system protein [Clostridium uliginosum]|uniref:Prepilin-type N-terminal cleavage/methylation domain-containing protein n=1 Tax=Clostridium uliginosum TaxID=119641 RepID=A0A1I1NRL9_9CLOT|nr:type II secretion system protein [Clostridium uliginosum]SFC96370.1 prepilin-type N-terminal cleavage/methylation domain-containing protein [Clostridium uliginosum]